jgi:hypothetical protein
MVNDSEGSRNTVTHPTSQVNVAILIKIAENKNKKNEILTRKK